MNDTCKYPDCPYAKAQEEMLNLLDVKHNFPTQCPNYIEMEWEDEKKNRKVTKDCALIRFILMQSDVTSRLIAVQQVLEEQRNGHGAVLTLVRDAVNYTRNVEHTTPKGMIDATPND